MERKPFFMPELFIGDRNLFNEVLRNRETIFVYDIDGIVANSTKVVYRKFTEKTGVFANPLEINNFHHLTNLAKSANLSKDFIKHAEDDWYDSKVLDLAQKFLYITPVVNKTFSFYGRDRNFVLTSRNPDLKESTLDWFSRKYPEFNPNNILIRDSHNIDSADFKVGSLRILSKIAPWVAFVDDSVDFIGAVLADGIKNCLVINIPQGKVMPDFRHERLIVIKRFPEEIQAMYPFMDAVNRAIGVY
jgi:hypothetical protein